jgi:hypothetical protein
MLQRRPVERPRKREAECITIAAQRTMGDTSRGGCHSSGLVTLEDAMLRLTCHCEAPNGQMVAQVEEACNPNLTPGLRCALREFARGIEFC